MRQDYECICDKCKAQITTGNDENDVLFNGLKLQYCPNCYQELFSMWEMWSVNKAPVKLSPHIYAVPVDAEVTRAETLEYVAKTCDLIAKEIDDTNGLATYITKVIRAMI